MSLPKIFTRILNRNAPNRNSARTLHVASAILLTLNFNSAVGAEDQHLPLRNHNPFLQIFGLPQFQSGLVTEQGQSDSRIMLDIANHSDTGSTPDESVVIDGETYYLNLGWRFGWRENLELGIDLPVVSHNKGFLDKPVEQWHDLFGLSNANRNRPANQLRFYYAQTGLANTLFDSAATGIGDIRLSAAYALARDTNGGLALRSSLKLPSGNEDKLLGSGAADFSLGLYHTSNRLFSRDNLAATAFAGILLLGDGEVLAELQKDSVGYIGTSATWHINERLSITGQLYGQSAYYDSALDEIGGSSVQLAVGGTWRPTGSRLEYSIGIVEDLFSDATTDVAFHLGIRIRGYD
jgi:hypothetical protein